MTTHSQLESLKKVLEKEYNIISWSPSEQQLQQMLDCILTLSGNEPKRELFDKILSIYKKPINTMVFEGLDTSTTAMLLTRAMDAVQNNKNSNEEKKN
ncbi:hypothetical protein NU090_003492 [Salmonella enterica]|uniref:hypothetical protein n=1 Tax=Klebsiella aerogenes TaxID=548 RepID=UPI0012D4FD65|nr:hypothetical protein [Klebsiella aerogenes]EAX8476042.1 hypothetical protein [Salmonella enterica]ECA4080671.1 hypothetical protein [Salmonella enterica subsp. enterica serovar Texas]EDX2434799.1 hypothetical protein [Salmonella enterica subsp. enterica serovar Koenigstuhl]EBK0309228.1 hypothetical protein [Salmonella enterica]EDC2508442.1 hypothetical protein [Salmonella enterica]